MRYVERNAARAGLVARAEDWEWSSLNWRMIDHPLVNPDPPPVALPDDWIARVNQPQTDAELDDLRNSIHRQRPTGESDWIETTVKTLGVEYSVRPRGRPRKSTDAPTTMPLALSPEK
jgi:putative transposase